MSLKVDHLPPLIVFPPFEDEPEEALEEPEYLLPNDSLKKSDNTELLKGGNEVQRNLRKKKLDILRK